MKSLPRPVDIPEDVFTTCLSHVRNKKLKSALESCKPLVKIAAKEFELKVTTGQIHSIAKLTSVSGIDASEFKKIYTGRMVPKDSPGREIYEKLKIASPSGICPLCSQRDVSTLDHYLAKSSFPLLTVVPINLIPACRICNEEKLSDEISEANHETIHPYFDNFDNDMWLTASVNQTMPVTITFSVQPPATWTQLLGDRMKYHFVNFSLNKLYSVHAGVELSQIKSHLQKLFNKGGYQEVRSYLQEQINTRSHQNINSWQAAFYRATSTDNWFCNGGFI